MFVPEITKSIFGYLIKIKTFKYYSTKLSYIHNIGKESLQYITVGQLLERTVNKYGERKALISRHQNRSLTFSEVLRNADKLAAGFRILGMKKNDCVGIWAPNLLEWYITKMACARAGLITVGLNPAYEPPEIEYCINKVGLKAIVCADKFKNRDYYDSLLTITPELKECQPGKLKSNKIPSLQNVITMSEDEKPGTYNFKEVLQLANDIDISNIHELQNHISPDDACLVHFTSGTTGQPKAALITHFSIVNNGLIFGKRSELAHKHHIICMQIPFFHAFGSVCSVMGALNQANTLVLPTDGYNRDKNLDAIMEEKCTVIYGTPTMYIDLIETQEKRKEDISLEIALTGGALCPSYLINKISKVLNVKKVKSVYGISECTAAVFVSLPAESEDKMFEFVGHVCEHVEVKVTDKNGQVVPFGTAGELCVRSYSNMLGYWNNEEETKKVLGQDGWFKTGDQFILQEDGYGVVVGRLKDVIIRGGENIFPKETEDFLLTHPDILEIHVIGLPHERLGEEACACIRVKQGSNITLESIVAYCTGKLSYFKIPSKIKIMDEFPKTTSGKIQKFKLREMIIQSK